MYNYYRGNSGVVKRVQEPERKQRTDNKAERNERKAPEPELQSQCMRPQYRSRGLLDKLGGVLPQNLGSLETEDLILLLILYLMYRDSGDTELLIIMGALLFL